MQELNGLTEQIIGRAIAVHRELGPGLLESTYESCLSPPHHHQQQLNSAISAPSVVKKNA
jgi:GxxExxY protein